MVIIDDITCDIAISEEHSYENEVTSHPVEKGPDVTDNAVAKPLMIALHCVVSDTPLASSAQLTSDTALAEQALSTRSVDAQAKLIALSISREPISVTDSQGTFPDMVLEKLSISKDAKTGEALVFKVNFKELRIVENERTIVQVAIPRAQNKNGLGTKISKKPPDNSPPGAAEDHRTALHKLLSGGADRLGYILPGDPGNPIPDNGVVPP